MNVILKSLYWILIKRMNYLERFLLFQIFTYLMKIMILNLAYFVLFLVLQVGWTIIKSKGYSTGFQSTKKFYLIFKTCCFKIFFGGEEHSRHLSV